MKKSIANSQSGQTIIEVLAALAIGVVIVAAISTSVISSLSNAQFGKNQNQANQYAQQGMEIIRNMRSANYTNFSILSGSFCLAKNSTTLGSYGSGCLQNVDQFEREVFIEQNSCDCGSSTKVAVTVGWSDSKCSAAPTPTPTSGLGPARGARALPNCNSISLPSPNAQFCHKVQLVSCLSDTNAVPTP